MYSYGVHKSSSTTLKEKAYLISHLLPPPPQLPPLWHARSNTIIQFRRQRSILFLLFHILSWVYFRFTIKLSKSSRSWASFWSSRMMGLRYSTSYEVIKYSAVCSTVGLNMFGFISQRPSLYPMGANETSCVWIRSNWD